MRNTEIRADVLLALQVALLDMITPNIRGVTCDWDDIKITIKFIFDGNYSEDNKELCEEVVTEVMSHFPRHNVELKLASISSPLSIKDEMLAAWGFLRRENQF